MPLFRQVGSAVHRVSPKEERIREDVVHRLIESNLSTFFQDLAFVARKPRIGGKEFDTLALNTATKSPVIVEYKRGKNRSVVEQVDLYYVKLKHNAPDVMVLMGRGNVVEDLGEIDFEHPQVIVIAKDFTPEQREILTLKREYLKLFQYQLYDDKLISIQEVEALGFAADTAIRKRVGSTSNAVPYSIEQFGMGTSASKIYKKLDPGILSLDSRVKPGKINKHFIGYGATGWYFCCLRPKPDSIKVEVKFARKPTSARGITVQRIPDYRHTPMTHFFRITSERQIPAALRVIKFALSDSM